jgi:MFS family permease
VSTAVTVLRRPYAARVLAAALVGRLPESMTPLAVVLVARDAGRSYAVAGALAAVIALGAAIGGPLLGRLVDRVGQGRVLVGSAVARSVALALIVVFADGSVVAMGVAVFFSGALIPPLEPALRALWPVIAGGDDQLESAYELDACAQALIFVAVPLLVAVTVAIAGTVAVLHVTSLVGLLGAAAFAIAPPSRAWRPTPRGHHGWAAALGAPVVPAVLAVGVLIGVTLGAVTVATASFAEDAGNRDLAGWLLAAWAVGELLGGVGSAARRWVLPPEARLIRLLAVFGVLFVPAMLVQTPVLMAVVLLVAGLGLAPALACAFIVIGRNARPGTVTETFAWLTSSILVGAAIGSALAGLLSTVQAGGYALAGAALLLGAAVWSLSEARRAP